MVRKTDTENLGQNIWLPLHMDKIVPSLLFNLQERRNYAQVRKYFVFRFIQDNKNFVLIIKILSAYVP